MKTENQEKELITVVAKIPKASIIKGSEEKLKIVRNWLDANDFDINNMKITTDRSFVSVSGRTNNLIIAIINDNIEIDNDQLMITAYDNQAKVWIATVDIEKNWIDWKYL